MTHYPRKNFHHRKLRRKRILKRSGHATVAIVMLGPLASPAYHVQAVRRRDHHHKMEQIEKAKVNFSYPNVSFPLLSLEENWWINHPALEHSILRPDASTTYFFRTRYRDHIPSHILENPNDFHFQILGHQDWIPTFAEDDIRDRHEEDWRRVQDYFTGKFLPSLNGARTVWDSIISVPTNILESWQKGDNLFDFQIEHAIMQGDRRYTFSLADVPSHVVDNPNHFDFQVTQTLGKTEHRNYEGLRAQEFETLFSDIENDNRFNNISFNQTLQLIGEPWFSSSSETQNLEKLIASHEKSGISLLEFLDITGLKQNQLSIGTVIKWEGRESRVKAIDPSTWSYDNRPEGANFFTGELLTLQNQTYTFNFVDPFTGLPPVNRAYVVGNEYIKVVNTGGLNLAGVTTLTSAQRILLNNLNDGIFGTSGAYFWPDKNIIELFTSGEQDAQGNPIIRLRIEPNMTRSDPYRMNKFYRHSVENTTITLEWHEIQRQEALYSLSYDFTPLMDFYSWNPYEEKLSSLEMIPELLTQFEYREPEFVWQFTHYENQGKYEEDKPNFSVHYPTENIHIETKEVVETNLPETSTFPSSTILTTVGIISTAVAAELARRKRKEKKE